MSRFGDVVSHHLGMVLPLEMVKCSLIQGNARASSHVGRCQRGFKMMRTSGWNHGCGRLSVVGGGSEGAVRSDGCIHFPIDWGAKELPTVSELHDKNHERIFWLMTYDPQIKGDHWIRNWLPRQLRVHSTRFNPCLYFHGQYAWIFMCTNTPSTK